MRLREIGLWCIIAIIVVFEMIGIGCIEVHPKSEEILYVEPIQLEQRINGVDKVIDLSGDKIYINGVGNQITILNSDVLLIQINGIENIVYYPSEANPEILDNGIDNVIRVY